LHPAAPCLASASDPRACLSASRRALPTLRAYRSDRYGSFDSDDVRFDDEDDLRSEQGWGGLSSAAGSGSEATLGRAMRAVRLVADRIGDAVVLLAPSDAPPAAVRAAVNGGLLLVVLSFVKGIVSVSLALSFLGSDFLSDVTVVFSLSLSLSFFRLDTILWLPLTKPICSVVLHHGGYGGAGCLCGGPSVWFRRLWGRQEGRAAEAGKPSAAGRP
jgi:hypothetical protein